ncbi:hypothetical protein [Hwanghaeella sp.]|uniref:hypothetical protein n=1 Tax=Hwanghaeella sp. TaxID=2605943 RepID=UPI003CCC2B3F
MATVILLCLISGTVPFFLAKRWPNGWLVLPFGIAGVVASAAAMLGWAAVLSAGPAPQLRPTEAILSSLAVWSWSWVISPISAVIGWRKGRKPSDAKVPETKRGAFDNLKR